MLEIVDLQANRSTGVVNIRLTIYNQDSELVLEGEQKFLLKKRCHDAHTD